jgi:ATP-dependent Lhr-like helicase
MSVSLFHSVVADWFTEKFDKPTEAQRLGWPEIVANRNTLIAAPTGSGKTLAAFMVCVDRLFRRALDGDPQDLTHVVYVSPLKALSSDVRRNLDLPLSEIQAKAAAAGHEAPNIRVMLRTGDTSASQRQAMIRKPPHILVTTPESLYLMLTAERSRQTLAEVETVIVDEIHSLARDKRGSHLSLSLERLDALCRRPPARIGLSATQKPIDELARFLVGSKQVGPDGRPECTIIDTGHLREIDLAVEVPSTPLSAVCSNETWDEIYERVCELIKSHRSTLIFVNTRRLSERVSHNLRTVLGEDAVASHHGSLSKEIRHSVEERLKEGKIRAIVATASLELGIDVGFIDLVCQISSPRSIATLLQRVGRSGHSLRAVPKGRLFPLTRDDLIESLALIRAARQGRLDRIEIPEAPLDILAQQIVASAAVEDLDENALFEMCRSSWSYRNLCRDDFDSVLEVVSEGAAAGVRRGAHVHRDRINGRLRARRGARIAASTSGGAIADTADYRVVTEADRTFVGTVNEDFAIESIPGDIFLLGNSSWRIRYVRGGEVTVNDANGAPATIPFWLGEAPGRTPELSEEVSRLREWIAETHSTMSGVDIQRSMMAECGTGEWAARQAVDYVQAQVAAIGLAPTQRRIVFERFFDEAGGMQLVIHSPLGSRINRAWGLALRKRFCRSFNFELQAAADDNGIVLSLGPQHSFPIDAMFSMLNCVNGKALLVQALLAAQMFEVRWRWNVTRALVVLRQQGGRRVPPHLLRMRADDVLSAVFPAQTACLENIVGDIEVPDHPLVKQTVHDCLHEAMDLDRWLSLLSDYAEGKVEFIARDTREPSPFSYEILNANPYAFLDDAPLEERRARAVATRRTVAPEDVSDLSSLDPDAVRQVREEAWPLVRDADELHDALSIMMALTEDEGAPWKDWFNQLVSDGRATRVKAAPDRSLSIASERWPVVRAAIPGAQSDPTPRLPDSIPTEVDSAEAVSTLLRGRLEVSGPVAASRLSQDLCIRLSAVQAGLEALEGRGLVLRGRFSRRSTETSLQTDEIEWCDRRLLARIHRLTLERARKGIQPVSPTDFVRFLLAHHGISDGRRMNGPASVVSVIEQLQGVEAPAGAWEREILAGRIKEYDPGWLDDLTRSGQVTWGRLRPPRRSENGSSGYAGMTRSVPMSLMMRSDTGWLVPLDRPDPSDLARGDASDVLETLNAHGALFFEDLRDATGLPPAQLEAALSELAAIGAVTSDGFSPIRTLVTPELRRRLNRGAARRRGGRMRSRSYATGGRWSLFPLFASRIDPQARVEKWADQLLQRYGIVFRDLLARENSAPSWYELVGVYRRLEARGLLRGGRFVRDVGGEQYALPEAVDQVRRRSRDKSRDEWGIISASDPLNLTGALPIGDRVPSQGDNRLAYVEGRLAAARQSGETKWHLSVDPALSTKISRALEISASTRDGREGDRETLAGHGVREEVRRLVSR